MGTGGLRMNREEMLKECIEIVTKHRQSTYGTPEDNFARIAAVWSIYLKQELKPHDVANMMIPLKVIRSQNKPEKEDNWLDMAGYAACGVEVATNGANRELPKTTEQASTTLRDSAIPFPPPAPGPID